MDDVSLDRLVDVLRHLIEEHGFIESHREGNTGVGKTLEDLIGVVENNDSRGDYYFKQRGPAELKSKRSGADNPVTLFSREPSKTQVWSEELLHRIGDVKENKISLHKPLYRREKRNGLLLEVDEVEQTITVTHDELGKIAVYTKSDLLDPLESKIPEIVFVTAKSAKKSGNEWFNYTSARLYTGLRKNKFFNLVGTSDVRLELRMLKEDGKKYNNSGTAFRTTERVLDMLYEDNIPLLESNSCFSQRRMPQRTIDDFRSGQRELSQYGVRTSESKGLPPEIKERIDNTVTPTTKRTHNTSIRDFV